MGSNRHILQWTDITIFNRNYIFKLLFFYCQFGFRRCRSIFSGLTTESLAFQGHLGIWIRLFFGGGSWFSLDHVGGRVATTPGVGGWGSYCSCLTNGKGIALRNSATWKVKNWMFNWLFDIQMVFNKHFAWESQKYVSSTASCTAFIDMSIDYWFVPYFQVMTSVNTCNHIHTFQLKGQRLSAVPLEPWMRQAQFGDFANCAQPIIDNFIACGEQKSESQRKSIWICAGWKQGAFFRQ